MSSLSSLGNGFVPTLLSLSNQTGIQPLAAVAVMIAESSLQATAYNASGAAGINQLMPGNYGIFAPLTVQQYLALTPAQQLPYAFAFWRGVIRNFGKGNTNWSPRDLEWLNYEPATYTPNAPDSHIITPNGNDFGKVGIIRAGDLTTFLNTRIAQNAKLWNALVAVIPAPRSIGIFAAMIVGMGTGAYLMLRRRGIA